MTTDENKDQSAVHLSPESLTKARQWAKYDGMSLEDWVNEQISMVAGFLESATAPVKPDTTWEPPSDIDPECTALCKALNAFTGITTTCSCCGHGKDEYRVFFDAEDLESLPRVAYFMSGCHTGEYGWQVIAHTDCAMSPVSFYVEGPVGGFAASERIAKVIMDSFEAQ